MESTKRKVTKSLKYEFTPEEIREFSNELAQAVSDKAEAEDELKTVKSQINSKIAQHDATINICAGKIRSGYEYRNTKCTEVYDYVLGSVQTARDDTGEVISTRSMTDDERQTKFNIHEIGAEGAILSED